MGKKIAATGQVAAGTGLSANGNHAHPDLTMRVNPWAPGMRAIWRNGDHDLPVVLTGLLGESEGVRYWAVSGSSTGIPEHELVAEPGADLLGELQAILTEAKVAAPELQPTEPKSQALTDFLLSAGMSDEANAQCVNRLYGGRFLHSEALGWLHWTGTHWATESAEAALDRAVVATLLRRIEAASQPESFEQHGALRKTCVPNKGRIEGAKHLLSSLVVALPSEFDAEPDLLNCLNGVVDLRTGALLSHEPGQRFMHCTAVAYKPNADQSVWVQWLTETVGSPELAQWLQMAVGYSLTGHTREEILFYLYGPPRAGKGAFTETLLEMLNSPLAREINFSTFTATRTGDVQNFDLAPLKPCRLVAASESNSYERFNEAKVKAMTGGNDIYCAHKHRPLFNYRPQFKVWLSSNQTVNADPDDDAVWGRVRLIEFPNSHLGAEDKRLKERLRSKAVLEGVLAWAVQGAMQWYALGSNGLSEPAGSVTLKAQQRGELDNIEAWRGECTQKIDPSGFSSTSRLYQSYEKWCKSNGVEPKKQKAFSVGMFRKGYRAGRETVGHKQMRVFYGLKLLPETSESDELDT